MENSLKEHRKLKNLTQEELSKSSGISIRTIQRIEKGLSTGSAHTIKTLANTLNIENLDLLTNENNSKSLYQNNTNKLKLMNFSILTMLVIPLGNIIFPSIIFFRNRDDEMVNTIGRKILSFQILSMLILPFLLITMFLFIGRGNGQIPIPITISYLLYGFLNIIITIQTSIKINKEKKVLSFFPNIL
jgi:transcriptional regulator with XRE-family HTH domain